MANAEAARQQASLSRLQSGEERMLGTVDEEQQKKLGAAIQKTFEAEYAEDEKRKELCVANHFFYGPLI